MNVPLNINSCQQAIISHNIIWGQTQSLIISPTKRLMKGSFVTFVRLDLYSEPQQFGVRYYFSHKNKQWKAYT